MVEQVGLGIQDDVQALEISLEVRHEHFDGRIGIAIPDRSNGSCPDFGTAIRKVVSGDGGEYAMLKIHFENCIGDSRGFREVEFSGFSSLNRAEAACASANVS
jgi:hypothetical protein